MDIPVPPQGSPMVAAYAAARAAAPGHLVLYRVGEFYEVLGDDAATVSRLLGIFPPAPPRRPSPGCSRQGARSPCPSSLPSPPANARSAA